MIDELKRLIKEELLDLSSSQSNVSHQAFCLRQAFQ